MRIKARTDANQNEIVAAFRKLGTSVQHLHQIGGGCPDLVVGYRGINVMIEIKDGSKPPSARKLTTDEVLWHDQWKGWKAVVESVDDCIRLVSRINKLQIPDNV